MRQETAGQGVITSDKKPADAVAAGGGPPVTERPRLDDTEDGTPFSTPENAAGKLPARKPDPISLIMGTPAD
jgi:hypothetical protein